MSSKPTEAAVFTKLGKEQREVADSTAPTVLVLGGAGVGKTTTALWAARRHLLENGERTTPRRGDKVLMVAFSRTAVSQIRERARGVIDGLDHHIEITTFHGLAYRLIRAFSPILGLSAAPTLQGEARERLGLTVAGGSVLGYKELIPLATRLACTAGPIADLLASRWTLVISDEFQDTSDDEWELLRALSANARRVLLADPNQMIYDGFKPGVSEARLDIARALDGCVEVTLPARSHRDPTQLVPALAKEVRALPAFPWVDAANRCPMERA